MQTRAQVVIIGGGVMGASLLYHLCREGWSDCVLLEKAELTSGSTWHAAGQITHGLAHYGLARINEYGVEFYRNLEAETGQSATWHGCGSLRVAYLDDEVDYLKHIVSVGRGIGVAMEIIAPDEIARLHPFFNLDGVKAALHTPGDGHVDPAGATLGMIRGARERGATVLRRNRALDVRREANGDWRVATERGDIACRHVVNAAGAYARQVAAWSGYDLPMANTTHHYFVTDTVKEFLRLERELPVVRDDLTYSGYVRMEQKAGLIGIYEKTAPRTVWDDGAPWEAENELFEPDYERVAPFLEKALERVPVLGAYGIKRAVHGAIPMPPDGNMLLGPAPGLDNYWCCCGSHVGVAWGPGAGKYLAQWMTHGAAAINMRDFDPRRFGTWTSRGYQLARAREDYVLRHEIPYPGRQRESGRPGRVSPLHERLAAAGAIHEEIYGWERPRWFAPPGWPREDAYGFRRPRWHRAVAEECRAVRERVGVMDLSAFAKLEVGGADAHNFIERMIANRAPRRVGGIVLAHVLNRRGTVEAEVTVARLAEERFYVTCAAFSEQKVCDWFRRHKRVDEAVAVAVVSRDFGCLALSGPRARDALAPLTEAPLDNDRWPWLTARTVTVAGVEGVRALRMSYQGELGWELHAPMDGMARLYDAVWREGRRYGIGNFGSHALNAMRLEKGFRGAPELTNEVTLAEAGAMRFCKLDKGEFIGREATRESLEQPLRWSCAYLEIEALDADALGGETVFSGARAVGQVSSGGFGFATGKSLAFAYVAPRRATPGAALEVLVLNERRPARVLGEAVYDPGNERPRM